MPITVHNIEQGSDDWLRLRANLYTGSNADKLLAHSTQTKIVNGVASSYALTEITGFGGNFYTRRGHLLEDRAIEIYERITGHQVSRPGFVTNSKYPDCGYSPDGHDDELGIPLEVKAFERGKHMKMFNGNIAVKILAQIHFGQFIWEKRGARLLIYNPEFAKKEIDGVTNPDYNPVWAFKIIEVKYNRNIQSNFKRVIAGSINASTKTA